MARVAGVILAAGTASRLGGGKQLLSLAGRPVLAHVLDRARRAPLDPLLVILGAGADAIAAVVDLRGTTVVHNPDFAAGQSTSVRAAVQALSTDVDAALFLLGDQPGVDPAAITRIVEAFRETGAPIVQPRYAEGRGNPVLIARSLFPALLELTGDTGARPLIKQHAEVVHLVDLRELPRPDDIDTPEDYARVRARFEDKSPEAESTP